MKHLFLLFGSLAMLSFQQMSMAGEPAKHFVIEGRLKADHGHLLNARVTITRDQETWDTLRNGLELFTLDLEAGHRYLLWFEADGMVPKALQIDTHIPEGNFLTQGGIFRFAVTLHPVPSHAPVRYDGPVGMIHVDARTGELRLDPDHQTQLIVEDARPPRKQVMAFVDPSKALGDWVEAQRREMAVSANTNH